MKYKFEGVKALAYISIMASLCVVFILGGMFIPLSTLLMLFILPLITSMVVLNVPYRYSFIYCVAVTAISMIDPINSLFMVIPSIITGVTFGILIKKYFHGYFIIFSVSMVLLCLQLVAQVLIQGLFDQNMEDIMCVILGFRQETFKYVYLLILYLISLCQSTLSYEIGTNELKKMSYTFNEKKNCFIPVIIITSLLCISSFVTYFLYIPISYLLIGFTFYFAVILAYYNFSYYRRKTILAIQLPLYVITLFSFFVAISYLEKYQGIYFSLLIVISEILVSLYIVFYQLVIKKGNINETLFDNLN